MWINTGQILVSPVGQYFSRNADKHLQFVGNINATTIFFCFLPLRNLHAQEKWKCKTWDRNSTQTSFWLQMKGRKSQNKRFRYKGLVLAAAMHKGGGRVGTFLIQSGWHHSVMGGISLGVLDFGPNLADGWWRGGGKPEIMGAPTLLRAFFKGSEVYVCI